MTYTSLAELEWLLGNRQKAKEWEKYAGSITGQDDAKASLVLLQSMARRYVWRRTRINFLKNQLRTVQKEGGPASKELAEGLEFAIANERQTMFVNVEAPNNPVKASMRPLLLSGAVALCVVAGCIFGGGVHIQLVPR